MQKLHFDTTVSYPVHYLHNKTMKIYGHVHSILQQELSKINPEKLNCQKVVHCQSGVQ
jgi:hypothetical protein